MYKVILQNIKAAHHLGEDKDLVASCFHFWKKLINKNQFPSRLDHCLQVKVRSTWTVRFFKLSKDLLFSTYQRISIPICVSTQISPHTFKSKLPKSALYSKYPPLGTDGDRTEFWIGLKSKQEHLFLSALKTSF